MNKFYQHQQLVKKWFDKRYSSDRDFSVGYLVLIWDKQHKDEKEYTKFQRIWLRPFFVIEKIGPSTIRLQTLEGVIDTYPANAFFAKKVLCLKRLVQPCI